MSTRSSVSLKRGCSAMPWWSSAMKPAKGAAENPQRLSAATLEELGASQHVVCEFIREGSPATPLEVAAFARALALRTLCVKESAVDDALALADQYNDKYDVWNRQGVDTAKRPDPRGWLARCPGIRDGFEQCLAMLPEAMT